MKRIKVVHVITRLDPGGSSENTLLTLRGLDKNRYVLTLIYGETETPPQEDLRQLKAAGVQVVRVKELVRAVHPWKDLIALIKLVRFFRRNAPDLVHTHSSKAGLLGRLAARLAGVRRLVHTPHGHVFYGYFNPITNWVFLRLERCLGKVTDRLITLTERGKEEHVSYRILAAERIVPIHSGILLERFREDVQAAPELGRLGPGPFIGMVARLVPIKGHRHLLEAAPEVLKGFPTARFLLVGDGPLRQALEARCRSLNISHAVIFLGEKEDVRPLLKGMTLVVLTSLNEGMGRVLLEAQAMGKPVIGTRVGGIPDIIREGETGLIVPPKDPKALAHAILSLLKDPQKCQSMGEAAQRWASQKFGVEAMVSKIARLYEELLQTP